MFTAKDIVERTKLTSQHVWRLVEYGIINPAEPAKGRGKVRRFDEVNLAEFMIAKQLYDLRAEPRQIWLAIDGLRRWKLFDKKTGKVQYESFWHYIRSSEYRHRRAKRGQEPIYLTVTRGDTIEELPGEGFGVYRQDELGGVLSRCDAAIIVNLAAIVTEVFF